ncbi:MAG: hypothetical protein JWR75_2044 [Devosia sp.]|nr:hypothetical protein [Devosia sp.]
MRILVRTSKWAIWARRLSSFALPLLVFPVLLHHLRLVDSTAFEFIGTIALAVTLLALAVSLSALVRLWNSGDQGWSRALWGLVIALGCLVPFLWLGYLAWRDPRVLDFATDLADPPTLVVATASPLTPTELSEVATTFPNARQRRYPLTAAQTFAIIDNLVASRGWEVIDRQPPVGVLGIGTINALETTPFGWRDEAVLRVRGDTAGTVVDMRSASISGFHDFGANGGRIETFLLALDNAVTLLMRDNPAAIAPLDGSGAEEVPEPVEGDAGG